MPEPKPYKVCGANRRQGGTCQKHAGWGTPHLGYGQCKIHGGLLPALKKHAAKLELEDVVIMMGLPKETEPQDALLEALWLMKGKADYCSHRIAMLSTPSEVALGTPSDDMRYWIRMRDTAVRETAHLSKMALDAGVAERQTALIERMGGLLSTLLGGVLSELGLNHEQQQRAPGIVRRHLELVAGQVV